MKLTISDVKAMSHNGRPQGPRLDQILTDLGEPTNLIYCTATVHNAPEVTNDDGTHRLTPVAVGMLVDTIRGVQWRCSLTAANGDSMPTYRPGVIDNDTDLRTQVVKTIEAQILALLTPQVLAGIGDVMRPVPADA